MYEGNHMCELSYINLGCSNHINEQKWLCPTDDKISYTMLEQGVWQQDCLTGKINA